MAAENITILIQSKGHNRIIQRFKAIGQAAEDAQKKAKGLGTGFAGMGKKSSSGVKKVETSVKKLDKTVTRTKKNAKGMWTSFAVPGGVEKGIKRLAGLFLGFQAASALTKVSDEFVRMNNTLKGFGVAADEIGRVRKQINALSIDARVNAVETATLYGRLRLATRDFGTSQKEVLKVTQTVSKALRLSGSSGLEASQSIRQLSQAFNKGKLDGDEFRSVMENAPIIQKLLSRQLGVTKQSLFDMAQAGKITAKELTAAFLEGADEIDKTFGDLGFTFEDFFQNFVTKFREAFGPRASSSLKAVGKILTAIGDNIGLILDVSIKLAGIKLWTVLYGGAKKYLATMIAIKAASRATAGYNAANMTMLMSGSSQGPRKGTSAYGAANMTKMMSQRPSMGKQVMGGAMMMGRGLGKAIPYAGIALIAYDMLDAMGLFGKSAEEMADAARNASDEMVAAKLKLVATRRPKQALPDLQTRDLYGDYSRKNFGSLYTGRGAMKQPGFLNPVQMIKGLWKEGSDGLIPDVAARSQATAELDKALADVVAKGQAGMIPLAEWPAEVLRVNIERSMSQLDEILKLAKNETLESAGPGVGVGKLRKEILNLFPGKEEDISFLTPDFDVGSSEGLSSLISLFRTYKDAIPLTEQEKLGNEFEANQVKIEKLEKRLALLNDGTKEFADSTDDLARAKRYTAEQIDKLSGGMVVETKRIKEQSDALKELLSQTRLVQEVAKKDTLSRAMRSITEGGLWAGGNAPPVEVPQPDLTSKQLTALSDPNTLASFFAEQKRAGGGAAGRAAALVILDNLIKQREEHEKNGKLITDNANKTMAEAAAQESVLSTLRQKRAELEAIGKTQAQINRDAFLANDPTVDERIEYDSLVQGGAEKDFKTSTDAALEKLKTVAAEFQRLQALAVTPADKALLAPVLNELRSEAAQLGGTIGKAGVEGSEQIIKETGVVLRDIAGLVGDDLGTALANAFNAAVDGVKAAIASGGGGLSGPLVPNSLGPSGPASAGPGTPAAEVNTQGLLKAADDAKSAGNAFDSASGKLSVFRNNFGGFGSFAAAQLKQTSRAAENSANEIQGFFESAFGSLEDALVGFVTTGEFDFKKLMNAILADLARLIVRMLIIKPLMSLLGGFFGFAQGGRIPAFASGGKIPKYATGGGMIGGYGGSTSDRYAAMVSPGEAVIRSSQVRRNRGIVGELLGGKKVKKKTAGGGGAVAVTYAPVINVTGGSDDGGEQQGQEIQAVIEKGFMEMLTREMRPNGALEGASRRSFS